MVSWIDISEFPLHGVISPVRPIREHSLQRMWNEERGIEVASHTTSFWATFQYRYPCWVVTYSGDIAIERQYGLLDRGLNWQSEDLDSALSY